MRKRKAKLNYRRIVLRLPDLDHSKMVVNQIDLILCHSLTIVREWHFGKMPLLRLSAVNDVMARNIW
jgi:hypothetical protein